MSQWNRLRIEMHIRTSSYSNNGRYFLLPLLLIIKYKRVTNIVKETKKKNFIANIM